LLTDEVCAGPDWATKQEGNEAENEEGNQKKKKNEKKNNTATVNSQHEGKECCSRVHAEGLKLTRRA
jgi:hypothetical protein